MTTKRWRDDDGDDDDGDGATGDGRRDTTTTAKSMAADDEDNEFDGDGAMGDGTTGDYGDEDNYGNGR